MRLHHTKNLLYTEQNGTCKLVTQPHRELPAYSLTEGKAWSQSPLKDGRRTKKMLYTHINGKSTWDSTLSVLYGSFLNEI